jgi:hypothetical protein
VATKVVDACCYRLSRLSATCGNLATPHSECESKKRRIKMLEPIVYVDSVVECICGNDFWGTPGGRCTHCVAELEYIDFLNAMDL